MRRSHVRSIALAFALVLALPVMPFGALLGAPDTAAAQTPEELAGSLPEGVVWQDWQATHSIYPHKLNEQCPDIVDPANPGGVDPDNPADVPQPGDLTCQLPMDTVAPTEQSALGGGKRRLKTVESSVLTRENGPEAIWDPNDPAQPEAIAFMQLDPHVADKLTVTGLHALVYVSFDPVDVPTSCSLATGPDNPALPGNTDTGQVTVWFEVRKLPEGSTGSTISDGQTLGRGVTTICPADETDATTEFPLEADIPLFVDNADTNTLGKDGTLQLLVAVGRPQGQGNWVLNYDAVNVKSRLDIGSNNAFQSAMWMEDHVNTRKPTVVFALPTAEGDRFSAIGFFGVKDAFGEYDNPIAMSNPPVGTDGKWEMSIVAPNNEVVSLAHTDKWPSSPPEFTRCDGTRSTKITCLAGPESSLGGAVKIWRMPDRPKGQGSNPVWNYTKSEIEAVSPGGGEFRLKITGGIRGNAIESARAEGLRFTVGGFGSRIEALKECQQAKCFEEKLTHQVCVRASNPDCEPADNGTTYLLRVTNVAPKADNFTLTSDLISASPPSGWRVSFSGPSVQGQETARLQGGEASVLKVRVVPPPGAASGSATVRVALQSQGAPDQKSTVDLVTEVNNVRLRDVGVILFPDAAAKNFVRGESKTFNFSVWNRGTDRDFFTVRCEKGANHDLGPTGVRVDESWNGEIRIDIDSQKCRETDPGKVLTASISPGDTALARVTLVAGFNVSGAGRSLDVEVIAQSQGDAEKDASATATASLLEKSSFKMLILEGSNSALPFSETEATRILRYGKDDPSVCPNLDGSGTSAGQPCGAGDNQEEEVPFTGDQDELTSQKLDRDFAEFAFYRIQVTNDGDRVETLTLSLNRVANQTIGDGCAGGFRRNSFTITQEKSQAGVGMGEPGASGVALLPDPVYKWPLEDADRLGKLRIEPGQSSVFYLRVHNEWNRHNITQIEGTTGFPVVCDSQSIVEVGAQSTVAGLGAPPFPARSVRAITKAFNGNITDVEFSNTRHLAITAGSRCGVPGVGMTAACKNQDGSDKPPELFAGEEPQNCPPVTPATGPNKEVCKYVAPGESQDWFITVARIAPTGEEFLYQPLRSSAGSAGITELVNLGWRFEGPTVVQDLRCPGVTTACNAPKTNATASGGEAVVKVRVSVPGNATISDFAGLQLRVSLRFSGVTESFDFFTIGAQKFGLKAKNLFGDEPVVIHHGERGVVSLNVSNVGAVTDVYSIDVNLPKERSDEGWTFFTPTNLTRVTPGTNKTIPVFFQSPSAIPCTPDRLPVEAKGVITVRSTLNRTVTNDTVVDVPYTVVAKPCGADDLKLESWNPETNQPGLATRPIRAGGGLPFTLRLVNNATTEKWVAMVRAPAVRDANGTLKPFIDGWQDTFGTECLNIGARNSTFVSYTVRAPHDALNGTFATYMVYAIESDRDCQKVDTPLAAQNFAQTALTASVIGESAVQLEPLGVVRCGDLEKIPVIPRAGCADFSIRVRNIGNSEDIFVFQPKFVNQSQGLPPDPWTVDIRANPDDLTCPAAAEIIRSLRVPAFSSCIIFVHVTAPLNIPQRGVSSLIDLVATGTRAAGEQATSATRIVAHVQDYDIRLLVRDRTVDAAPGQTLQFTLNITNAGNAPDTFEVQVDIGGLAGFWNVTTNLPPEGLRLLNGSSKDVQVTVQVPRVRAESAPTSGAVVGVTVRSRQVEDLRPLAVALGSGSPLEQYLVSVAKTELVTINLFPFVSIDVDDDKELELAIDRNKNALDGFEAFSDPFAAIVQAVDILAADGDGDGRIDHFVDINLDGRPDRFWDPDGQILTDIRFHPDLNGDGTLEFLYDSDDDLSVDRWVDPSTRQSGEVIERDYDNDGGAEFLIDTDGDGKPDRYFDPDRGPRGLVTTVRQGDSPQRFSIDTNGDGRHDTTYDRVTGEVKANVFGVAEFLQTYWWVVFLFVAVVVVAGYLVYQRYRKPPLGENESPRPQDR